MNEVSLFRLYLLRSMYLLIVLGLGLMVLPGSFHHEEPWELMEGVVACMLTAFWLCQSGLRYPLLMLPLLLWELVWKTIWLISLHSHCGHPVKWTSRRGQWPRPA